MWQRCKQWFIPHVSNDYRPTVLEKMAVLGLLLMVLISFAMTNLQALLWINSSWMVSTILPAVIVTDTNEARNSNDLTTLRRNDVLDEAARLKAEDMAARNYFAHYGPDGRSPWYYFDAVEYPYIFAGENLAVHFTDSSAVVDAWLNSPTHRDNILNEHYREIGIGTAQGRYEGYDTVFVVQLFGTPARTTIERSVTVTPSSTVSVIAAGASTSLPVVAGASTTDTPEPTVVLTEEGTVVLSSFAATSRPGEPALLPAETAIAESTPVWLALATQPHRLLQLLFTAIALFVLICLCLSIIIEVRRQHPHQIASGVGLLLVMLLLLQLHTYLTQGILII